MPELAAYYTLIDPAGPRPVYTTPGAAAFDLSARETTDIAPHEIARIPTNVIMHIPDGYCLLVTVRSSTPARHGLLIPNAPGIIDRDYCGPTDEIMIQVLNFRDTATTIERGTRIAQALFVRSDQLHLIERMSPITAASRGGFGSTGE